MKKFLGVICLLYSIMITYICITNKINNFLALQMQIYIKISAIILFIMGIVLIINNQIHYKFKITDLILLLPILMILLTGDGRLTLNFANNRMTSFVSKQRNVMVNNKKKKIDKKMT